MINNFICNSSEKYLFYTFFIFYLILLFYFLSLFLRIFIFQIIAGMNNYIIKSEWIYLKDNKWNILAEITFEKINKTTYDIDHTFVDESMRGQWIADELVEKAVEYIKWQWFNITASCPFAKRWLKNHK